MVSARTAPAPAAPHPFYRRPAFAAAMIAIAALLAYFNSFGVPFVFDDELAIVGNPTIRNFGSALLPPQDAVMGGLPISGRPVVNLSVATNYAISGLNVGSYHVVNLCIHIAAGLVFFGVVRRTLLQPALVRRFGGHAFELALLAAALWTLHPLQTESVTYISQRAEALLGLWYLLTLWCYIRVVEPGASAWWGRWAVVACALGMMTKEVMVSAPIFVALYDRALVAGSWREAWTRHRRWWLALASTWLVLAWFVVSGGGTRGKSAGFGLGVTSWDYLLTQCGAIVLYLKLSFWPSPLVLDYGTTIVRSVSEVWWQAVILVGLFGATIWALIRRPAVGCLGAGFFMVLAPSSSVIPLVGQTIAEHRMYLPLAAVVASVVLAAYSVLKRPALWLLAVAAAVLGLMTVRRNEDYASAIRICEDTVAKRPDNARAMALLADYYHRAGNLPKAREWLERSLEVQPGIVPVLNNLGNVLQELGDRAGAVTCYQQALAQRPNDANALNNLGNALILSGRMDEGITQLEAALRVAPGSWGMRANLANALAQSGRMAEAAGHFAVLVQVQPNDADLRNSYAGVLQVLGRRDEAIGQLEALVRLRPNDPDAHNRLGTALARSGQLKEALKEFLEALRLNPAHESARQNAAIAQRRLGGS